MRPRETGTSVAEVQPEGDVSNGWKTRVDRASQKRPEVRTPRRAGTFLGSGRRRTLRGAGSEAAGEDRVEAGIRRPRRSQALRRLRRQLTLQQKIHRDA